MGKLEIIFVREISVEGKDITEDRLFKIHKIR